MLFNVELKSGDMKYSDLYLIENPFPQKGIPREEKIMETTYIPDDQFFREFLSDIENNISKGFHVIVGDNGVGKTQILRFLEEKIKIKSDSNLIPICIKCVKVSDNVLNSFLSELLSESYKIGLFTQFGKIFGALRILNTRQLNGNLI